MTQQQTRQPPMQASDESTRKQLQLARAGGGPPARRTGDDTAGGEYTLRVHIDAPAFPRHDKSNGQRYVDPVTIAFTGVKIKTGQKRS